MLCGCCELCGRGGAGGGGAILAQVSRSSIQAVRVVVCSSLLIAYMGLYFLFDEHVYLEHGKSLHGSAKSLLG